jgi:integrase
LDPTLRPLLERHLKEKVKPGLEAWVFGTRDGSRRSPTTRWFAVSAHEAARRAGITRLLTFHDLRRTYLLCENELLKRIDAFSKYLEKQTPGVRLTRAEAVRVLLLRGLAKASGHARRRVIACRTTVEVE